MLILECHSAFFVIKIIYPQTKPTKIFIIQYPIVIPTTPKYFPKNIVDKLIAIAPTIDGIRNGSCLWQRKYVAHEKTN